MSTLSRVLLVLLIAMSATAAVPSESEPSPVMNESTGIDELTGRPGDDLNLPQAVDLALRFDPRLFAASSAVAASSARVEQAGLLPNPDLALEVENFAGSGPYDGFDGAEITAVVTQPFLLGGKIRRRRAVAESDRILSGIDLERARIDTEARTKARFFEALAAQQRLEMARDLEDLAERFAATVRARVDAGKVSPVEGTRAGIEVAQAGVRTARALRDFEAARIRLASMWGSTSPVFSRLRGSLPRGDDPPPIDAVLPFLSGTPDVLRLEQEIERQERVLAFENAFRLPDLGLSAGPRRFRDGGRTAWVAAISIGLPIFDRNQGERRAAEFDVERVRFEARSRRVEIEARLAAVHQRLRAASLAVTTMSRDVVPAAEKAFRSIENGYREGKFAFLDVLDAQRAFFDARSLLLDSREEYALTLVELERLTTPTNKASGGSQGE